MVTTQAHNVLTSPTRTVYLNEPLDKLPDEEDKTEPSTPESVEPTSATLSAEEQTYKKRYDDLKTHYDRTKQSTDAKISELEVKYSELLALKDKPIETSIPKTPAEFKEFQEKYPELAANIITAAVMATQPSLDVIKKKQKELEDRDNAVRAREGIEELKKYHPDFEVIKDDARFAEWFKTQPVEIQNLIRSPNPKVIAAGLDKFKEFAGIKTPVQKVEAKKDATRDIKTPNRVQIGEGQKRTYTNAEIHKMSLKEYEKLQDDIKAAQYDGRIVG